MSDNLKIRKLHLRNWKNFLDVEVAIEDRVFLVGPNASGKSNFLDVFRFLRDLASTGGGFQDAVLRRRGVSAIRCLAARRYSNIEVHVELQDTRAEAQWKYEIVFSQDNRRRPVLRKERVTRDNKLIVDRPNEDDEKDPARKRRLLSTAAFNRSGLGWPKGHIHIPTSLKAFPPLLRHSLSWTC